MNGGYNVTADIYENYSDKKSTYVPPLSSGYIRVYYLA